MSEISNSRVYTLDGKLVSSYYTTEGEALATGPAYGVTETTEGKIWRADHLPHNDAVMSGTETQESDTCTTTQ